MPSNRISEASLTVGAVGEYLYANSVNREVTVMDRENFDLEGIAEQQNLDMPNDVVPDNPGPAITGNTPVLGSIRRSQGLPVARDEIADELDL